MSKLHCPSGHTNNGNGNFCSECGKRNVQNKKGHTPLIYWNAFQYAGDGRWVKIYDENFDNPGDVLDHIHGGMPGHYEIGYNNKIFVAKVRVVGSSHCIVLEWYSYTPHARIPKKYVLCPAVGFAPTDIQLYR